MSKAFACDVCRTFQEGDPIVKLLLTGTDPDRPALKIEAEWCDECLAAFQDWRESREPDDDEPDVEDAGEYS